MKKAIVTTTVNNYQPELCQYTIPNLKRYADIIGADFFQTSDRIFPELHPAYEKLQVHEIAKHYDKTILIDADIMLHPRIPDLTESYGINEIGLWMQYDIMSPDFSLWDLNINRHFIKDGRNLGVVGALVGCSKYTYDIFEPIPVEEALEIQSKIYRPAIIDEYVMSHNMAKYSYRYTSIWNSFGIFHAEMTTKNPSDILSKAKQVSEEWT